MRVQVESPDLQRFLRRLGEQQPLLVQRQLVRPSMQSLAAVWRRAIKQVVRTQLKTRRGQRTGGLLRSLFAKAYGRPRHAPNVTVLVGARSGPRARTRTTPRGQKRAGNQPPAGARLNFIRGTQERETRRGWNRGFIEGIKFHGPLESLASAPGFAAFSATFQERLRVAWDFRGASFR